MLRRLDETRDKLLAMKDAGYPRQGHYKLCDRCAEKDTCPRAYQGIAYALQCIITLDKTTVYTSVISSFINDLGRLFAIQEDSQMPKRSKQASDDALQR